MQFIPTHGGVTDLGFAPDTPFLDITVGNTIKRWHLAEQRWQQSFSLPPGPRTNTWQDTVLDTLPTLRSVTYCGALSSDGATLATGSSHGSVKLWDVEDGTLLRTVGGHLGSVNSVTFAPDGNRLASAATDGTVKLWNLDAMTRPPGEGLLHHTPEAYQGHSVRTLAVGNGGGCWHRCRITRNSICGTCPMEHYTRAYHPPTNTRLPRSRLLPLRPGSPLEQDMDDIVVAMCTSGMWRNSHPSVRSKRIGGTRWTAWCFQPMGRCLPQEMEGK